MAKHKPRILFLSTGNATRSLIAEGFLRNFTGDRFDTLPIPAPKSRWHETNRRGTPSLP